jgi:ketosteroid isomerase-like protein
MTLIARFALWVVGALTATMMLGCSSNAENSARSGQQQRNADVVRDAFARGVSDENSFYSILADDVEWTVARANEPATYTSRADFLRDGAGPIVSRLDGPIQAEVLELITEGDVVVARWRGTATALDGLPYVNDYAWVMTMRDEQVVRVAAYLDLVVLGELLDRVAPAA